MKNKISLYAVVVIVIACFLVDMDFKNWREPERVIENDVHGYYGYLPAYFIFDDLKVEKSDYKYSETGFWFWMKHYENGTYDFGKTYGVALLYAPFFGVAHQCAKWFDYPLNGFSDPYKYFLLLSSLFYLFTGLVFVRKSLLRLNFSDQITAATLLLLGLGTNLFCYSSQSGPYPHVYNFCLIAIFVYSTIRWHEDKHWKYLIGLAFSFSIITLISLPNVVVGLFFVLYNVRSISDLSNKKISLLQVLLLFIVFFLVWLPQWKYWKLATGSYFGSPDHYEKFYFTDPEFIKGLFSFRKGWLIYTPLMTFAIVGLFFLRDQLRNLFPAVLVYFIVTLYIVFSWWNWWYGGSFGQRTLVDSYAVFAIPLAAFLAYIAGKNTAVKIVCVAISLFFIWLNIFQTYQYEQQSLHYSGMTSELYIKQFGKLNKIEDFERYVKIPDDAEARIGNR